MKSVANPLVDYEQVKEFKFFAENNGFKLARKFIDYKKIQLPQFGRL